MPFSFEFNPIRPKLFERQAMLASCTEEENLILVQNSGTLSYRLSCAALQCTELKSAYGTLSIVYMVVFSLVSGKLWIIRLVNRTEIKIRPKKNNRFWLTQLVRTRHKDRVNWNMWWEQWCLSFCGKLRCILAIFHKEAWCTKSSESRKRSH